MRSKGCMIKYEIRKYIFICHLNKMLDRSVEILGLESYSLHAAFILNEYRLKLCLIHIHIFRPIGQ